MSQPKQVKQKLVFCEDCGEKNFFPLPAEEEQAGVKEVRFRCKGCSYLNTFPLSHEAHCSASAS